MFKNTRALRRLMPFLLVGMLSGTALASPRTSAPRTSINIVPGITRIAVTLPSATKLPTVPKLPLPVTGLPKVTTITPQIAQVSCPEGAHAGRTTSATITTCGGGGDGSPPPEVVYWWRGDFSVSSRAGVWYSFAQEFEWHVYGGRITKVTENLCMRTGGAFYYYGCGQPNGPYNGEPRIVQQTGAKDRVLAEWKFCAHPPTDGCQWPHTDVTFGSDGSIVGTVWYQ